MGPRPSWCRSATATRKPPDWTLTSWSPRRGARMATQLLRTGWSTMISWLRIQCLRIIMTTTDHEYKLSDTYHQHLDFFNNIENFLLLIREWLCVPNCFYFK